MTLRTVNGKWLIVDGKLAADANCCCSPPAPPCSGPCDEENPCPEGCECLDGECVEPPCSGPCEENEDCAPGCRCVDGECVEECVCPCSSVSDLEGMPVTLEGYSFVLGEPSFEFLECEPGAIGFLSNQGYDLGVVPCSLLCRIGVAVNATALASISCNSLQTSCPYWEIFLQSQCVECNESGSQAYNGLARLWSAKIAVDEDCQPVGSPFSLELVGENELGDGPGDCDPQPPSLVFSPNPLP
jgi:hypothetical protein